MLRTTTNKILSCNPCLVGWDLLTGQGGNRNKWYGTDDVLEFADIIRSNGLADAFWAIRVFDEPEHKPRLERLAHDVTKLVLNEYKDGHTKMTSAYHIQQIESSYQEVKAPHTTARGLALYVYRMVTMLIDNGYSKFLPAIERDLLECMRPFIYGDRVDSLSEMIQEITTPNIHKKESL